MIDAAVDNKPRVDHARFVGQPVAVMPDSPNGSTHVTPAGRAFMKRMTPLVASHEAEIASGLRPDERDRLIELLEKVFSTVAALER